jgi:hypothetical protein
MKENPARKENARMIVMEMGSVYIQENVNVI